jgi:hypothetical protein
MGNQRRKGKRVVIQEGTAGNLGIERYSLGQSG